MKNIFLFSASKCHEKQECRSKKEDTVEETIEEIKNDTVNPNEDSKLNFQLFDLDTVFAN